MNELRPARRDKLINFKVSNKERIKIQKYCEKIKVDVSKFIRHAVFKEMG